MGINGENFLFLEHETRDMYRINETMRVKPKCAF